MCNTGLTGWTDFNTLLEFDFLSSLIESLCVLSTLVLSRSPCCIPLYSTATYTQERNKTHKNELELANLILYWATFHLYLSLRASTRSWLEQLCLESVTIDFFNLCYQDFSSCPCHLSSWFDEYYHLELCKYSWHDWCLGLNHSLALLHPIWYLDVKSSTYSSLMYGSSRPSPCWSFFNHHHDPHNSLCPQWAYNDSPLKCWCRRIRPHVLNIFCDNNRHETYVINSFSSFSLDEILLVFMTLKIYNHIDHNVCLDEWIASI
jgi:hypothetical protein